MTNKLLYVLWGVLFSICAALGFIPEPEGALKIFMRLLSLAFFVPPALVLRRGTERDRKLVRNLAGLSLGLTLAALVANFLSAMAAQSLGTVLYYVLAIVSCPMVCSGYWAMSLFLWACLLIAAGKRR